MEVFSIKGLIDRHSFVQVFRSWKSAAGKIICQNVSLVGIKPYLHKGQKKQQLTLFIKANDPIWAQEIRFQMPIILEKIQNDLKQKKVADHEVPQAFLIKKK